MSPTKSEYFPSRNLQEFTLPTDVFSLKIEFADLNFARSSADQFAFLLEGFDQDWSLTGTNERSITYTNLDPGEYLFWIKGRNKEGLWSERAARLKLIVPPPIWKTWWMKLGALCVLISLLLLIHHLRIQGLKRAKKILQLEVEARTQVISKQNRDKSKFIADAAHDLRQPMQAIGNLLESLRHSLKIQEYVKGDELLELAQKAIGLMRSSFHSILELSRVETGMISPKYEVIDLNVLLENTVATLSLIANECGVEIQLQQSSRQSNCIRTDKNFLTRILSNLIGNAIKYHDNKKPKKLVIIRTVSLGTSIRIYIVDNGIGISESNHQKIFQAFFQVCSDNIEHENGHGLGLSIVAAMFEALEKHTLHFKSVEKKGTKFWIDIQRSDEISLVDTFTIDPITESGTDLSGIYIIYVEDDPLVRMSTITMLNYKGFICSSFDSIDGLRTALNDIERIPDLILTDHLLGSEATSIDVIKMVRSFFDFDIPAIILTGESGDIETEVSNLAEIVLFKPVSANKLYQSIDALRSRMISHLNNQK